MPQIIPYYILITQQHFFIKTPKIQFISAKHLVHKNQTNKSLFF